MGFLRKGLFVATGGLSGAAGIMIRPGYPGDSIPWK